MTEGSPTATPDPRCMTGIATLAAAKSTCDASVSVGPAVSQLAAASQLGAVSRLSHGCLSTDARLTLRPTRPAAATPLTTTAQLGRSACST